MVFPFQILLNTFQQKANSISQKFWAFFCFTLSLILTNGEITMKVNESSRIKTRRREKNEESRGGGGGIKRNIK